MIQAKIIERGQNTANPLGFDAVLVIMKLLTGNNGKIILRLKNEQAKQLKKELIQIFNI